MSTDERLIEKLEKRIPERVAYALRSAYKLAINSGHPDRAFVWDNSGSEPIFIAEITEGSTLEFQVEEVPAWFQRAFVDRL